MPVGRKQEAIDLMKLYSQWGSARWKKYLKKKLMQRDINGLVDHRYALQAGMSDLVKMNMENPKIIEWYLRLIKSMENAMRMIFREHHPSPLDNYNNRTMYTSEQWKRMKKERDVLWEKFIRKAGY